MERKVTGKRIMEEIMWFNKDRTGWTINKSDVTVSKVKDGISVIIRNGWETEISSTGYIRVGFSSQNRNRMYFMAADEHHGWKLSSQRTSSTFKTVIRDERVVDGMTKFIGDYNIEVNEDNICFIDRKNVLD